MILVAAPFMTFVWASVASGIARFAGCDDGTQAACGLIAIAACLIIGELGP